jgi:hypothetical protein
MSERKGKAKPIDVKEQLARDQDFVRAALEALLPAAVEKGNERRLDRRSAAAITAAR